MWESVNVQLMRSAIVGAGYPASFHARAIRKLKDVELIGVCDTSIGSARALASSWGIPEAFNSLDAMLRNQRLDVVHVLAPLISTTQSHGRSFSLERTCFLKNRCAPQLRKPTTCSGLRMIVH